LDCNDARLNGTGSGIGIYNLGFDNVTLDECQVGHYHEGIHLESNSINKITNSGVFLNYYGFYLDHSDNNNLTENYATFNTQSGFKLTFSNSNKLTKNMANWNEYYGIDLDYSDGNEISGNTANSNDFTGIRLDHSDHNTVIDNTANSNDFTGIELATQSNENFLHNNTANSNAGSPSSDGIKLILSNNNILSNNTANSNNESGVYLSGSRENTLIGNELNSNNKHGIILSGDVIFNSRDNLIIENTVNYNEIGLYIKTTYSFNNTVNMNNFCSNVLYDIKNEGSNVGDLNNCDITDNWDDYGDTGCAIKCPVCRSCEECTNKLNSGLYDMVTLITNITDDYQNCIDFVSNDTVFDCNDHAIDGDDITLDIDDFGIRIKGTNNTIKNCIISDFSWGIDLANASGNVITDNTIISNTPGPFNMGAGVYLWGSDSNDMNNNMINDNYYGIIIINSNNNTINSNIVCENDQLDFNVVSGTENVGDENVCTFLNGWNDTGTVGCSYSCIAITACYSCEDCNTKLNNFDYVTLAANIINHVGDCITFGKNNTVFNCLGQRIDGDQSGNDKGIYIDQKSGNTVRNCEVIQFHDAIHVSSSSENRIDDNTLQYNTGNGIYLYNSPDNDIINNFINENNEYGIELDTSSGTYMHFNDIASNVYGGIILQFSDSNTITSNDIVDNMDNAGIRGFWSNVNTIAGNNILDNYYGIILEHSSSNTLNQNLICSSYHSDIHVYESSGNSGINNRCDIADEWNDIGTTGCTHKCIEQGELGWYTYNYGLSFNNPGGERLSYGDCWNYNDNCAPGWGGYYGNYKETFGSCDVCNCVDLPGDAGWCNGWGPLALAYYPIYRWLGALVAQCTGMSITSLEFYYGDKDVKDYDFSASKVRHLQYEGELKEHIAAMQGKVVSGEMIDFYLHEDAYWSNPFSTSHILTHIRNDLNQDPPRYGTIMIIEDAGIEEFLWGIFAIPNFPKAHTVVVDTIEDINDEIVRIYVYDSNRENWANTNPNLIPGFNKDNFPHITINKTSERYYFETDEGDLWNNTAYEPFDRMGYMPYSILRGDVDRPEEYDIAIIGILAALGSADGQIEDTEGRVLGFMENRSFINEMPDATILPIYGESDSEYPAPEVFALPRDDYKIRVMGHGDGNYSSFISNGLYSFTIQNVTIDNTTKDNISIHYGDGIMPDTMSFETSDAEKQYSVEIVKNIVQGQNGFGRIFKVNNTTISAGSKAIFTLDLASNSLIYTNHGNEAITYSVEFQTTEIPEGEEGYYIINKKFPSTSIHDILIGPMETHVLTPTDWMDLNESEVNLTTEECDNDICGSGENWYNCPEDCELDWDGDGVNDTYDNCWYVSNPDQNDTDSDYVGNVCDNCIEVSNPNQTDPNLDGYGVRCDPDVDNDGNTTSADMDICYQAWGTRPGDDYWNPDCDFVDGNDIIDIFDIIFIEMRLGTTPGPSYGSNADQDGWIDERDNCWYAQNPDQNDTDGNCPLPTYTEDPRCGDACELEGDTNGDCYVDILDLIILSNAFGSTPEKPNWDERPDLKEDNKIDVFDLSILGKNFGKEC